jgi:hypothetical protein
MRRLVARRGGTPPSFKPEGWERAISGAKQSVHPPLPNSRPTVCISTSSKFSRNRRVYLTTATLFVVVVSPFATLADPAADIADRELRYSNQPSKLEHPSSPSSMAPLPASSARMALRQTPHASSARLSQVQRHFSTTSPVRKEIQDAYILSAARTPTGKVRTAS